MAKRYQWEPDLGGDFQIRDNQSQTVVAKVYENAPRAGSRVLFAKHLCSSLEVCQGTDFHCNPAENSASGLLSWHLEEMQRIALAEVERMAREIMRKHPSLREFVMAMGVWFFTQQQRHGRPDRKVDEQDVRHLAGLGRFIDSWDRVLHLTGTPMRFTVDGPVITDW